MADTSKKDCQKIVITNRERIEINEIEAVISFGDDEVYLMSGLGKICIEGEELKIIELNKERKSIEITGSIRGAFYVDASSKKKRGIWS